jgi:hypothetical protein
MTESCPRCQGLLLNAETFNTEDGPWSCQRCLNCGNQFDEVVLHHRSLPEAPEPYSSPYFPVWDPVRRMLQWRERLEKRNAVQSQEGID